MGEIFVKLSILEEAQKVLKKMADNIESIKNNFKNKRNYMNYDIWSRQRIDQEMKEISKELEEIVPNKLKCISYIVKLSS